MAVKMRIEPRKICEMLGISYRSATLSSTVARWSQMAGKLMWRKSFHPGLGFIGSTHAETPVVLKIKGIPRNNAKPWK
jgi:hypothetical protein